MQEIALKKIHVTQIIMMESLDKTFWNTRYETNETGWDVGEVTTPLKAYFDQLEDKSIRILIPGAGNAYEAEHLHKTGFKNVFIVDISPIAIQNFKKRVPSFPDEHIICDDFFNLNTTFDLIIEQTFFCAIHPNLRANYAQHCVKLLTEKGKIVGLMFCFPLTDDGPPFGGDRDEYMHLFSTYFTVKKMEHAYNSIKPRSGRELFVQMIKK